MKTKMTKMKKINREESGQALVELAFALVLLCVFVSGIIDFGRAIYDVEVMKNLVGAFQHGFAYDHSSHDSDHPG